MNELYKEFCADKRCMNYGYLLRERCFLNGHRYRRSYCKTHKSENCLHDWRDRRLKGVLK